MRTAQFTFTIIAALGLALALLSGCTKSSTRSSWAAGDPGSTIAAIDERLGVGAETGRSLDSLELSGIPDLQIVMDRAYASLATGDTDQARSLLVALDHELEQRRSELRLDESITTILDERARNYPGRLHEHVLLPSILALSDSATDTPPSATFAHRISQARLNLYAIPPINPLQEDPARCLVPTPFDAYVATMILSAHGAGDAPVALERFEKTLGTDHPLCVSLHEDLHGLSRDEATVHIFHFLGVAPELKTMRGGVSEESKQIAATAGSIKTSDIGWLAQLKLPTTGVGKAQEVAPVRIMLGSEPVSSHEVLRMSRVLDEYITASHTVETARGLVRRLLKLGVIGGASEDARVSTIGAAAAFAAEDADTRSWALLPESILVSQSRLSPGPVEMSFGQQNRTIETAPGSVNVVLVFQPWEGEPSSVLIGRVR